MATLTQISNTSKLDSLSLTCNKNFFSKPVIVTFILLATIISAIVYKITKILKDREIGEIQSELTKVKEELKSAKSLLVDKEREKEILDSRLEGLEQSKEQEISLIKSELDQAKSNLRDSEYILNQNKNEIQDLNRRIVNLEDQQKKLLLGIRCSANTSDLKLNAARALDISLENIGEEQGFLEENNINREGCIRFNTEALSEKKVPKFKKLKKGLKRFSSTISIKSLFNK